MSKNNDGGPAFPNEYCNSSSQGMSLRDYFAGQALATMDTGGYTLLGMQSAAQRAYNLADAMLAERKKQKGGEA